MGADSMICEYKDSDSMIPRYYDERVNTEWDAVFRDNDK